MFAKEERDIYRCKKKHNSYRENSDSAEELAADVAKSGDYSRFCLAMLLTGKDLDPVLGRVYDVGRACVKRAWLPGEINRMLPPYLGTVVGGRRGVENGPAGGRFGFFREGGGGST